jgi:hypothetical protein
MNIKIISSLIIILILFDSSVSDKFRINYYAYFDELPKRERPKGLKLWYKDMTNKDLDLNNAHSFNEKIQWTKIYNIDSYKTRLSDKYLSKVIVSKKVGSKYVIPTIGVWENFDFIRFDSLPNRFVLKCNHGNNLISVVLNKDVLDIKTEKTKFDNWMLQNQAFVNGLELQFRKSRRKIFAEKFMPEIHNLDKEFRVYCFDGIVHFIQVFSIGEKSVFYDKNWSKQNFNCCTRNINQFPDVKRPARLEELIAISQTLSKGISFVQIVYYILGNEDIIFKEFNFTPQSGIMNWSSEAANIQMGNLLTLKVDRNLDNTQDIKDL